MDQITHEELRRLKRLCPRHHASLLWATLMDSTPSDGDPYASARPEALERALSCARCRARNDLDGPARTLPSEFGPTWNPTTANLGSDISRAKPSLGYAFGDRRTRPGPPLHIGWVIAGVCILAVAVGLTVTNMQGEASSSQESDVSLVEYADLKVGDCVRDMVSEEADLGLDVVSCTEPHTDEVFATFALPRASWPGANRVDQLGWRGCDSRFESYVGVPPDDTSLDVFMNPPVEIGWPDDRVVVCTVAEGSDPDTGSLRDANH